MSRIRNYEEKEGILVFDPQMIDENSHYDSQHLDVLASVESRHFWFQCRKSKICQVFRHHVKKEAKILEIGAGTGFIAEQLQREGFCVEVADIHFNGLQYAKSKGIQNLYQFDLYSPPFQEAFDIICLFDVLEHLKDEKKALEGINRMLKSDGKVILTVPAHKWLWSREDVIAGHHCRFTRRSLKDLFHICHFQPLQIRYFFFAILPFLLLRRFFKGDRGSKVPSQETFALPIYPVFNAIFHFLTKAEFLVERFLPNLAGGSLIAIGQKKSGK